MENTFQTLQADYKSAYSDYSVPAGTIIFATKGYGSVQHASPTVPQRMGASSQMVLEPSTDRELLRLWNHATIERKYGVYASKPLLQKELEARGYVLADGKHRWKKAEIA